MVSRGEDAVTVANASSAPLNRCVLIRRGVSVPVGDIAAGGQRRLDPALWTDGANGRLAPTPGAPFLSRVIAEYESETVHGTLGDCVVCGMDSVSGALTSDTLSLAYGGSTAVVYHLYRRPARAAGSDER
jgi:hypothetical protein